MVNRILGLVVMCAALSIPSTSTANTIVDTGTPEYRYGFLFGSIQYFAGEFSTTDAYLVTGVEAYFSNRLGAAGTVDVAIHADGGDVPGSILQTSPAALAANAALGWYGAAFNYLLMPGTYWVSFKPSSTISGEVVGGGTVPNPMNHYAQANGTYNWRQDLGPTHFDYLNLGMRVNGDLVAASVPDGTSTLSLFMGVVLIVVGAQRLRI